MSAKQSKRNFLKQMIKISGVTLGVLTFGKFLSFPIQSVAKMQVSNKNNESMKEGNKVLIAYESKFGSTASIAKFIGENTDANGKILDVLKIKEVTNLSQYSYVIVGSAIQYDKWMPEARKFIQTNEMELLSKPVSYFLVCLALSKQSEKAKNQVNGYESEIKKLAPTIEVNNFGKFAGVLDYKKCHSDNELLQKEYLLFWE